MVGFEYMLMFPSLKWDIDLARISMLEEKSGRGDGQLNLLAHLCKRVPKIQFWGVPTSF